MTHILINGVQIRVEANGNWCIFLPDNQLNLVITAQQRQRLLDWAMPLFTEWMIEGKTFDITHDYDPLWDYSGETVKRDLEELERQEIMRGTLGEWMNEELTGNWSPTFMSGYGKSYDRYFDGIQHHISSEVHELLKMQVALERWDEVWDSDEWGDAVLALEEALLDRIAAIPAAEAYRRSEAETRQKIAQRAVEVQERQRVVTEWCERSRRFFAKHFRFLSMDTFVDKPAWRKLGLAAQLRNALASAAPADIEAVVELGLPGNFSKSVNAEIKQIATEFSNKRK